MRFYGFVVKVLSPFSEGFFSSSGHAFVLEPWGRDLGCLPHFSGENRPGKWRKFTAFLLEGTEANGRAAKLRSRTQISNKF